MELYNQLTGMFESNSDLRGEVASIIEGNLYGHSNEEIMSTLKDITTYGCVSGMVGGMIYYHETIAFFDKWYDSLEDLFLNLDMDADYERVLDCKWEELDEDDLVQEKNNLVWLAFEIIAGDIMHDLEDCILNS